MPSLVQRQIGDNDSSSRLVANIAVVHSKNYNAAFLRAIEEFKTLYPEEELLRLLEENDVDAADGIDWEELAILFAAMASIHRRATIAAGSATALGISEATGEVLSFQMTEEQATRLRAQISEDIGRMVRSTERGADALVRAMLEDGLSYEEAAKKLHQGMGMTEPAARKWRKVEAQLKAQGLLEDDELEEKVAVFGAALVAQRTKDAAGNEIWNAVQTGRLFSFELALFAGIFTARSVKIWWTFLDEFVCPQCGPMHGQAVPVMQNFVSPLDGIEVSGPGIHVKCRCWLEWRLL